MNPLKPTDIECEYHGQHCALAEPDPKYPCWTYVRTEILKDIFEIHIKRCEQTENYYCDTCRFIEQNFMELWK